MSDHIIPRWEWRTFGDAFGECDRRFAAITPENTQEGDELYLLSPATDENVKIRNRLMDIKQLQQVNADGLEQWRPVMKAAFPLPSSEVGQVYDAFGVPVPQLARPAYTLEQFVEGAEEHKGSWWPDWLDWLKKLNPDEAPARAPGGSLTAIEDAPGSYVRVRD